MPLTSLPALLGAVALSVFANGAQDAIDPTDLTVPPELRERTKETEEAARETVETETEANSVESSAPRVREAVATIETENAAPADQPQRILLRPEDAQAEIEQAVTRIESLGTLKGRFVQVAPDGAISNGDFFLRRPGRLRFQYDDPNPLLVVADGTWVVLADRDLETVDRYPIGSTPLKFLLNKTIDRGDLDVVAVERLEPAGLALTVQAREEDTEGMITLVFRGEDLNLSEWVVTDMTGQMTTVYLSDVVIGESLSAALFVPPEPKRRFLRNN